MKPESSSWESKVASLPLPSRLKPSLPALGVASLLAAGTSAYGQVTFTSVNGGLGQVLTGDQSYQFVLNSGSHTDLTIYHSTGEGGYLSAGFTPYDYTLTGSILGGGGFVAKLGSGITLNSGTTFDYSGTKALWGQSSVTSDWASGATRGYVGFEFGDSGNHYYGWVDLSIDRAVQGNVTIYGYAVNLTPGGAITTPTAIPEPAPAALVIGATALLALRQRRRKAA